MVGVRNRAGGVDDSVPPESLEEFVCPTPKQDRVEIWDTLRGGFGLLLIRHDPVQVPVGSRKVPVRGYPVEHHDPSRVFHMLYSSRWRLTVYAGAGARAAEHELGLK